MQKDLASVVAQQLGNSDMAQQLVEVIKNQASELQKRGNRIVDLEDKNEMLQKNVSLITSSNKQLEVMIETLRAERTKLLQEIEELKVCSTPCQEKVAAKKKKGTKEALSTNQ
jgi:hypothetical protein